MISLIVLALAVSGATSSLMLPNGCFVREDDSWAPSWLYIACTDANFMEVMQYSADQNKSISKLSIKNCNPPIPRIEKLPTLKVHTLVISGCGVGEIDDDAFVNIKWKADGVLNFSNNSISKIPNVLFVQSRLETLILNRNKIGHNPKVRIKNKLLENVTDCYNLKELSLQHNELTELTESMFAGLRLKSLILRNNNITKLHPETFKSMEDLEYLNLKDNQLQELPSNIFYGLRKLQYLFLDNNKLTELKEDTFQDLDSVVSIDLANNRLKHLPSNIFNNLGKLHELYLNNNELDTLPSGLFPKSLSRLYNLYLQSNRLTTLSKNVFSGMDRLVFIDLRDNNLTKLPQNCFEGHLISKTKAELDDVGLRFLISIYLSGNPLVCDENLAWLVEFMKVKYVWDIADIDYPVCAAPPKYAGIELKDVEFN